MQLFLITLSFRKKSGALRRFFCFIDLAKYLIYANYQETPFHLMFVDFQIPVLGDAIANDVLERSYP
jgi:hypothetical protein